MECISETVPGAPDALTVGNGTRGPEGIPPACFRTVSMIFLNSSWLTPDKTKGVGIIQNYSIQ